MEVLLWALGILIAIQITIIAFLAKAQWDHISECRAFRAEFATVKEKVTHLENEVGDRDRGIRAAIHKLREDLSPFSVYVQLLMEKERQ